MFSLSGLNPAVIIYFVTTILSFVPRLFSSKKVVQSVLKFCLFIVPIFILFIKLMAYEPTLPTPFVLRQDWFRSILYGGLDGTSFFLCFTFLVMMLILAVDYVRTPIAITIRTIFLMASGIGVVFAKDAMATLFYFELTSLLLMSNVLADRSIDRNKSFLYSIFHVLGGSLLLSGFVAMITIFPANMHMEFLNIMPVVLIMLGILVFVGMPPFAFTIVDTYGKMDLRNLPIAVAIISKMIFYALMPIRMNLAVPIFPLLIIGVIFYVSTRVFLEKSLTKVLIMSALSHSATTIYFFNLLPEKSNDLISFWLSVNILSTFYIFSVLRLLYRFDLGISKDIRNLRNLRGIRSMGLTILFLMVVMVIFGIPTSLLFVSKEIINSAYGSSMMFTNLYFASKAINFLIGWKLIFSYFGIWGDGDKSEVVKKVIYRKHPIKVLSLMLLGAFILSGGFLFYGQILEFFGFDKVNIFKKDSIVSYFASVGLCGSVYVLLFKFMVPDVNTEDRIILLFMPIKNSIMSVYRMFAEIVRFIISSLDKFFIFYRRSAKTLLKKAAIGVFSSLYGAEVVLCIATFIMFAMLFYCVK